MKAREGLVAVAVLVMVLLAFVAGESTPHTVTTTQISFTPHTITMTLTLTLTSSSQQGVLVEEVDVQPVYHNAICALWVANQTATYLLGVGGNGQVTTKTESLTAGTITKYENITFVNSGSTCTEINPYYNKTFNGCGPCV